VLYSKNNPSSLKQQSLRLFLKSIALTRTTTTARWVLGSDIRFVPDLKLCSHCVNGFEYSDIKTCFYNTLLSDGVVKSHHSTPGGHPLLSSISESTGVPGVSGVVSAAESGVWMQGSSSHLRDDVVPHSSDVISKDSESCIRHSDDEVIFVIIIKQFLTSV